ncbi:trypsin-1-like [Daphnia pulicaria]|uniref:trypsin-1-like n=1 Tax=Daphnia pulicaria TaxID=35523 RepID=UPI001EEB034D|nr:trypsin-1-like [Daphnia pulicaria]
MKKCCTVNVLLLLVSIVFAMGIGSVCCFDIPTEFQEGYQQFPFSSFPFSDPVSNIDTVISQECGISKFYRQRRPRDDQHLGSIVQKDRNSVLSAIFKKDFKEDDFLKRERLKARIINGKQSKPGAWPWQVSLQLLHPKMGFVGHWCGGVLLNGLNGDFWVLTAAHCISNDAFNYPFSALWTAVVGEHDRAIEEGFEQRIMIDKIYLHERFKEYHHDIALMKLQKSESLQNVTDRIRGICLPTDDNVEIFQGVRCIATGWGQSKKGNKLENILHQTELPVVENSHCKQVYGTMFNIPINNYHLCAGPITEGGAGTCVGDSGGPLQCSLRDGRWYLAGITSFGSGCAKPGFPDVFTRITYYLPWIRGKFRSSDDSL